MTIGLNCCGLPVNSRRAQASSINPVAVLEVYTAIIISDACSYLETWDGEEKEEEYIYHQMII